MKRFFLFFFLISVSTITINGQKLVDAYVTEMANDASMRYASLSFCVLDVETGEILAQRNAYQALTPASIMKLVTTGASLGILGKSYRFKTELQYDGTISNGTLNGNLYLKGYGDPTLGSSDMVGAKSFSTIMNDFLAATQKSGIRKVNGVIVGDASHYEEAMPAATWQWNDLGNYYGAGASGLSIHENMYRLNLQQVNKLGGTPKILKTEPALPYLNFFNELTSDKKGTGDNAYIFGAPYSYTRHIRGTIPVGSGVFKVKGAIPDPAFFAAYTLTKKLELSGISTLKMTKNYFELQKEGRGSSSNRKTIYTMQSPTLDKIIERTNYKSVNLYAETLLKEIGFKKANEGSTEAGVEAILQFYSDRGLDMNGFFMEDGSGLSPRNAITTFQMSSVLRKLARDEGIFDTFYGTLPIGGKSGTVRYMFKKYPATQEIRLKSGSMTRVRSYAGYTRTKSGRLVAFAIIANNFTGKSKYIRPKMEKIIAAITQLP